MSDQGQEAAAQSDRAFFLVVTIKPRLDMLAEAEAQLHKMRAASQAEEGCVFMTLVDTPDEPDCWTMIEKFASRAAWDEHMASDHNRAGNEVLEPMLREPSILRTYTERVAD